MKTVSENIPRRLSQKEVLNELLTKPPEWMSTIKDQYDGDWTLLLDSVVEKLPGNHKRSFTDTVLGRDAPTKVDIFPEHIHVAAALIHAGRREGVKVLLSALAGTNTRLRSLALNAIQGMAAEHFGRVGRPGTIPLSVEELSSAFGDALKGMYYAEANGALKNFCQREEREYLPVLMPLLRHCDPNVFRPVIKHFVEIDCDNGALDVIAQHLLTPGVQTARELRTLSGTTITHDLSEYLAKWTVPTKVESHRQRAAQIASQAIIDALDSENPHERLAFRSGWLPSEDLLNAVCQCPSHTTVGLLERVSLTSGLEPRTRADALLKYKSLTGITLAVRPTVIQDFFALDTGPVSPISKFIEDLVTHGLVTMKELAHGAANTHWTFHVTQEITQKLDKVAQGEMAVLVAGLLGALASVCESFSRESTTEHIGYLAGCLRALPRSAEDNAQIQQSLNVALVAAQHIADSPWLAEELMGLLQSFGGGAKLDLGAMDPWNAMQEHWRRGNITWSSAVQLLVEAGAICPDCSIVLPQAVGELKAGAMQDEIMNVLHAGGRGGGEWLSDIGYEHHHDKLFSTFVSLVSPPIELDAVTQLGDVAFSVVPEGELPSEVIDQGLPVFSAEETRVQVVVSFQGQTFQFYAHPNGTYMDAWAVFHAFNRFMTQLERPERLFWLGSHGEGEEYGFFVCALPEKFMSISEKLRLPLRTPR